MKRRDYYESLGVSKGADDKTIKQAYRKLAKKYHPDMNPGDEQAEQRFKEITEAYNVLSDKEKRKLYDQFGFAAFDENVQGGPRGNGGNGSPFGNYGSGYGRGFGNGGSYQEYHFEGGNGNMNDIFEDLFGGMFHGDFGSGAGQGQSRGRRAERKGRDVQSDITISFEEAALGCDKVFHLQGGIATSLQVHIPAGIEEGKSIRLKGKGQAAASGGQPGDLYLKVHILPKAGYERKGMDVYTTAEIPFTTAVFGGEVQVETLYGKVMCKIPAGMQCGRKLRLRGKGIVSMKQASVQGDQYVTIQIQVPTSLNQEAREKLKEYEKLEETVPCH